MTTTTPIHHVPDGCDDCAHPKPHDFGDHRGHPLAPPRRWEGYGSAPCTADDDDDPADTLEADLATSLRALGIEPPT